MFYKIKYVLLPLIVFIWKKNVIYTYDDVRLNISWEMYIFGVNYPFNNVDRQQILFNVTHVCG